jgi:hypothetical protein
MPAGVSQVLQLLLAAASRQSWEHDRSTTPCIVASLCSLPAAKALQAYSITAVLYRGISTGAWHRLLPLLELHNAKQMSTQCLCGLVKAAAAKSAFQLVGALCRYAWYPPDTHLFSKCVGQRLRPENI